MDNKMSLIENKYIECMNIFIDNIGNKLDSIQFEKLYTVNYKMTLAGRYECLNMMFIKAKNKIIKLNTKNKHLNLNMLFNIFMYPLRIGCILDQKCLLCDLNINCKEIYCDEHTKYENHLNNIRKFTKFNNDGMIGSRIYHNIYGII